MTRLHHSFRPLLGATLTFLVVGATHGAHAANGTIGVAVTNGSFQINRTRVWGNSSLFNGSTVETATAPSQIRLDGGTRVRLASETRVQVYDKKLVMETGMGELESAPGYSVEARSLRISAGSENTIARIALSSDRKVLVAAVRGSVLVANSAGMVVANVVEGASLDFEPQAEGASAPTHATGCLVQKAGRFLISEQTTNVVLELNGVGLDKQLGNRVEITGVSDTKKIPVQGTAQVVKVAGLKLVAKGGCTAVAKKLGASAAAGAAAASAAGTAGAAGAAGAGAAAAGTAAAGAATAAGVGAATVAVVGGVAAAATVGGLAAAGELPGQSDTPPSASR